MESSAGIKKSVASMDEASIWLHEQFSSPSAAYNIPVLLECSKRLDRARFEIALAAVVQAHPALRRQFCFDDDQLLRCEGATIIRPQFWKTASLDAARSEIEIAANRPFDTQADALIRVGLWDVPDGRTLCLITLHHLVADADSISTILRSLEACYCDPAACAPAGDPGSDRREHQPRQPGESLRAWYRSLSGQFDTPRPDRLSNTPVDSSGPVPRGTVQVPAAIVRKVSHLALQEGVSDHTVWLALVAVFLARASSKSDFVFFMPVSSRDPRWDGDAVGLHVKLLPLRVRFVEDYSFYDLVGQIADSMIHVLDNRATASQEILAVLRELQPSSQFDLTACVVSRVSGQLDTLDLEGEARVSIVRTGAPKYDFGVEIHDATNAPFLFIEARPELYSQSDIDGYGADIMDVMVSLLEQPSQFVP